VTNPTKLKEVEFPSRDLSVADGELLFARTWRWDAARLVRDAEDSYHKAKAKGEVPDYSISVFGLRRTGDESVRDLAVRLMRYAKGQRDASLDCSGWTRRSTLGRCHEHHDPPPPRTCAH
jgi:hypothetical protein